jgi:hypothetical protein
VDFAEPLLDQSQCLADDALRRGRRQLVISKQHRRDVAGSHQKQDVLA